MKKLSTRRIQNLLHSDVDKTAKLLCGEKIGSGFMRDVYVLLDNPDYVVKIERKPQKGNFANVTEWRNWINNREWKWFSQWLAPCEMINETGQILIQQRVIHGPAKNFPKHIPVPFTDLKRRNFGWIGDQFVCCDYAFIPIFFVVEGGKKMKYAKWWGKA